MAMEMFFTLLDDPESDVRMVADENLNRQSAPLSLVQIPPDTVL